MGEGVFLLTGCLPAAAKKRRDLRPAARVTRQATFHGAGARSALLGAALVVAADALLASAHRDASPYFWLSVLSMNFATLSCSAFSDGVCAYTMWPDG